MNAHHPTLKQRRSNAILRVLKECHPLNLSAKQVQDRIYDILKNSTPCTSAIGNLCGVLAAQGKLTRHSTTALNPEYTYTWRGEE